MARSLYAHLARVHRPVESASVRARRIERVVVDTHRHFPLALAGRAALMRSPEIARLRVAVVGAGFAGLTAAWWLRSHGVDVDLFEASRRVGGRVRSKTVRRTARVAEHGAELIGRNHGVWLRLAKRFGLALSLISDDENYASMGLRAPLLVGGRSPQSKRVFEELDRALAALNRDARGVDPHRPWAARRARELDAMSVADWIDTLRPTKLCRAVLRFQLENMQAIAVEQQSYLGLLAPVSTGLQTLDDPHTEPSTYWVDSEVFRCADGNQSLARSLAEDFTAQGGRIRYGTRVTRIACDAGGAWIDSERRAYDRIVLAVPPTCWPSCDEPWPAEWRTELGPAAKLLMTVRDRFWVKEGLAPNGSSDALGLFWEGTDNQNVPLGTPVELTLFLGGTPAATAATQPDPTKYCLDAVEKIYPSLRRHLLKAEFVNWPGDRYVRGGYSCPRVGDVCTVVRKLHAGWHRIDFAGEHTAMPFFGYMEGALQSGIRAARAALGKARRDPRHRP
jgi:monoamine oxidase